MPYAASYQREATATLTIRTTLPIICSRPFSAHRSLSPTLSVNSCSAHGSASYSSNWMDHVAALSTLPVWRMPALSKQLGRHSEDPHSPTKHIQRRRL